jgi:hypothetical protein
VEAFNRSHIRPAAPLGTAGAVGRRHAANSKRAKLAALKL